MKLPRSHPLAPSPAHPRWSDATPRRVSAIPPSAFRTPRSQSAVALVVTLILLAVITFMAISFLVLSRAEHGSVITETDQTQARQAAETAVQRGIMQVLVPMMAQNNEFNYGLLVSTSYVNAVGFIPNLANPTNVNYDFVATNRTALSVLQRVQNIANLQIDPRPPVYITNRFSPLGGYDFRFFLNLNRNTNPAGLPFFDPTGWLMVTNHGTNVIFPNGQPLIDYFVGDPQWIGILDYPDRPHGPDNRFVSRFAYLIVPAGKTLDFNRIHNYAKEPSPNLGPAMANGDGFLRNMGVGPWEGNLAAFLVDLNSNVWPFSLQQPPLSTAYYYDTNGPLNQVPNQGIAFDDAFSILRYRYRPSAFTLQPVSQVFGAAGATAFVNDYVDGYVAGPVNWLYWPPPGTTADPDLGRTGIVPWAGADNTNHYFTPQELYNRGEIAPLVPTSTSFSDRLLTAGNDVRDSYNSYTFYRMLAGMGSDTAGNSDRINLNYCNLDTQGHVVPNMETNFIPWLPEQFFTNTANALLRSYGYNFTVTNIQIYPTNFYTPSVHRLLQLAANLYDATTNRFGGTNNFPTVFRPYFRQVIFPNGIHGVMIAGYREANFREGNGETVARLNNNFPGGPQNVVLGINEQTILPAYGTAISPVDASEPLVTGIPLVIGAKKGLPNFNEFGMQAGATVTRKVHFRRVGGNTSTILETNQMYLLSITNSFGLEAWNSYPSTYSRRLEVRMDAVLLAVVTNELGTLLLSNAVPYQPVAATVGRWPGFVGSTAFPLNAPNTTNSFRAVIRSALFLTNSMYSDTLHRFQTPGDFERGNGFPIPHWYLSLRPMVRFALVDTDTSSFPNHIIDYVSFDAPQLPMDLTPLLTAGGQCDVNYHQDGAIGSMWCTNRTGANVATPTFGVLNQLAVSEGNVESPQWRSQDHKVDIDFFRAQMGLGPLFFPDQAPALTNSFDSPYSPTRAITFPVSWQANDPLVHYTIPDLLDPIDKHKSAGADGVMAYELDQPTYSPLGQLGGADFFAGTQAGVPTPVNGRYRPWGGNPFAGDDTSPPTNFRMEVKDPLVTRSDAWDFPTNKYPSLGWIGRVHRGTPWQTVYLKSPTNDWTRWLLWSGNNLTVTNREYNSTVLTNNTKPGDYVYSLPENDRALLDLFSASFSDNAARGRMSINQETLAAWSAVLSGVVLVTNWSPENSLKSVAAHPQQAPAVLTLGTTVVPPAGQYDPLNTPTNFWPPIAQIVHAININRTNHWDARSLCWTNTFEHLGDILAVPQLTVLSPFLNLGVTKNPKVENGTTMTYQQSLGITDEMYERIPQQILGLLQCDHTPRFVIYAYGQALRPAEHSIVTGGPYFQLCTNYQITAEVATRAVVRIEGAPAHPHAVIESFNVMPPD